jgi:hypothetical protein
MHVDHKKDEHGKDVSQLFFTIGFEGRPPEKNE